MVMKSMEAGSAHTGRLPKGCLQCRRGSKMVLLITGRCSTGCFYCPLSLEKKGKDVLYANERRCSSDEEVLDEARMIGAEGTGITGGDPVQCLDRTLHFIRLLKKELGPRHHIHLYTSSLDVDSFRRLEESGLDELRLHPNVEMWDRLEESGLRDFVHSTSMKVGFEVPSLPGEDERTGRLVAFAEDAGMDFVNLNELEFSEGNWDRLEERGLGIRDELSSAVRGSEEAALRRLAEERDVPVHYCSSRFKDTVQLRRRIKRRARRAARPTDVITGEGTLLKGVVEGPIQEVIEALRKLDVEEHLFYEDKEKKRVEVAPWVLEHIADRVPFDSFLVEEYPTADRLEVEREPLRPR
jgi:hypothetical protein